MYKKLKLGNTIYTKQEILQYYLDKGYIFTSIDNRYKVLKDIKYNHPYRFVYGKNILENEKLTSVWNGYNLKVYELPKTLISFKELIQCN